MEKSNKKKPHPEINQAAIKYCVLNDNFTYVYYKEAL